MKTLLLIAFFFSTLTGCGSNSSRQQLSVEVTSFLGENQAFKHGDELSFLVNLNENAWLYLYYENAEQEVYQLIPSALSPDNMMHAGDFIPFPANHAPFQLSVSAPYGNERIWAFAVRKEIELPELNEKTLTALPLSLSEIQELARTTADKAGLQYSEDFLHFRTEK